MSRMGIPAARYLSGGLAVAAFLVLAFGSMKVSTSSIHDWKILGIVIAVLLIGSIVVNVAGIRCPNCNSYLGARSGWGWRAMSRCPFCGASIDDGADLTFPDNTDSTDTSDDDDNTWPHLDGR